MDINWIDEIPGSVQGTPVNRLRLMGMQGYFPGITVITEVSETETNIVETSTQGTTTTAVEEIPGGVQITRQFIASDNKIITKVTTITDDGTSTTVTDSIQG